MSAILLSSEQSDDNFALISCLANRIACYLACSDAVDPDGLPTALRRDGFSEIEVARGLEHALAVLADRT